MSKVYVDTITVKDHSCDNRAEVAIEIEVHLERGAVEQTPLTLVLPAVAILNLCGELIVQGNKSFRKRYSYDLWRPDLMAKEGRTSQTTG